MRHWKLRSKSQSRIPQESKCNWTIEGQGRWRNSNGQLVQLNEFPLLKVSEIERGALQRLALTRLQELNLGCYIEVPKSESIPVQQTKKRTILLRKKAVTTNFFDSKEKDKGTNSSVSVFGVPLSQCIANDRLIMISESGRIDKHCEEVLSALRISSREGSPMGGQIISSMLSKQAVSRGSISDVFPGEMQVPLVVQACIHFLEEKGLQTLGIFRVSGSQKRVRQLREVMDKHRASNFDDSTQPHDVAQLLKEYFRDLPEPLLTRALYRPCLQTQRITNQERKLAATRWLLYLLPSAHRDTLSTLLKFLHKVSRFADDSKREDGTWVSGNKMDCNNLATVFGPNLLRMSYRSSDSPYAVTSVERAQERSDINLTVRTLIENSNELFQIPPEDFDAVYQQFMIDDPDLLNAMLSRRLDNSRNIESSAGSSSNAPNTINTQNLNLKETSTQAQTKLDNQQLTESILRSASDWNVKSRPLVMTKDNAKSDDASRGMSKERRLEKWLFDERRPSGGSSKDQPYSVTAAFTITLGGKGSHGFAGILPQQQDNPITGYQEQSRQKSRRVPYGKVRHMTTPAYYTEETITSVTIPSPRHTIVGKKIPETYKALLYEGKWDQNVSQSCSPKSRSSLERHVRTKLLDHKTTTQPSTPERWKRQEIIASEHVQI